MGKWMINAQSEISIINQKKYLHPPTWENIQAWLDLVGNPNYLHVERFYGMPHSTLSNVKCGQRDLAFQFWHIIYDKIVPTYGSGFIKDYEEEIIRGAKVKKKKAKVRKIQKKNVVNLEVHHSRLAKLR